jgi:small-conductance mechanosensitive channel
MKALSQNPSVLCQRPMQTHRGASAVSLLSLAVSLVLSGAVAAGQSTAPGMRRLAVSTAPSAPAASSGELTDAATKTLEAKLAEAKANLAAAEAAGDAALVNAQTGISTQDLAIRRALLRRLVRLFEQQLSNAVELEAAKKRGEDAAREAQSWTRFAEPAPYSVLLTDQLRDEIQVEQLKNDTAQAALVTLDALVAENKATLREAEERIRQLNEQLEAIEDPSETPLSWQRDLARLQSQVASAALGVLTSERQFREQVQAECRVRLDLLQRQLLFADAGVKFTQADLDKVNNRISEEREKLYRELTDAEARVAPALLGLEAARAEQRLALAASDEDVAGRTRAAETVATRQAQFETAQSAVRTVHFMLDALSVERTIWGLRFNAYGSKDRKVLEESQERLAAYNRRLDLWRTLQREQSEASPGQIELQEAKLHVLPPGSDLLQLAEQRLAAMRESDQLLRQVVDRTERVHRLAQRWDEELRVSAENLPFLIRVGGLFSGVGSFFYKLWTFELLTADDTITVEGQTITGKRSITVGKILLAVLSLAGAVWVTGPLSRISIPFMTRILKVEARQAKLVQRWLRAFLVVCLLVFSLALVKIPLTVFAFAGGALAIGLGFGMQNVLKNFVSGVLILFERPVRVGDVVDVVGQKGTITVVGLRASVIQLWDGTETIIPNSALLENNLTNWTYSDRKVRFSVTVGVVYGSDPRRVTDILSEAAGRHELVEIEPKPQVLFTGFGADGMIFELRFWVDITKADSGQVSSDLRMIVAAALAEGGIVIAVPQRDVHLSPAGPIQVAMVPSAESPDAASHSRKQRDGGPRPPRRY